MNTHHEIPAHPLTEAAAAKLWDAHAGDTVPWEDWYGGSQRVLTSLLRAAFDAGQKYQDDLEDSTIRDVMQDVHHLRVERDDAIARAVEAERRAASYKGHFEQAYRNFVTALTGRSEMADRAERAEALLAAPAADADRPWGPLGDDEPLNVGDEVRRDLHGVTRIAVVARVDEGGGLWAAEGDFIGEINDGTWYVRRADQELPEWTGAIIEGAVGGRIQATAEGVTYTAAEAIYRDGMWYGAWRTARGGTGIQFSSSSITPGTWQVADQ